MPIITGGMIIEGALGHAVPIAGAPAAGTNEVQTLDIGGTPTGGTFRLSFEGRRTGQITWSAVNATLLTNINAALDAAYGTAAIVATAGTIVAGIGTVTLTFSGTGVRRKAVPTMTAPENALTGTAPTLSVVEATPGVTATYRDASIGSQVVRTDTGILYINTSTTPGAPTWTVVGAQT